MASIIVLTFSCSLRAEIITEIFRLSEILTGLFILLLIDMRQKLIRMNSINIDANINVSMLNCFPLQILKFSFSNELKILLLTLVFKYNFYLFLTPISL